MRYAWMILSAAIVALVLTAGGRPSTGARAAEAPAQAEAERLVLVGTDAPAATIVADPQVSPSEQWAVEELQTLLLQISGAKLPVTTPAKAPAEEGRTLILVGRKTAAAAHPELDLDSLGDEGFIIKRLGRHLVIAGGEKQGTLYGVYTFLEDLGCRWWTPTESTIPKRQTIAVGPIDRREVPRLEYRDMLYGEMWNDQGRLWAARNKVNGMALNPAPERLGGHYFIAGSHGHNSIDLVEESAAEMKPEMWALSGGKRSKSEVCQTHPEVIAATIRSLVKVYKAHPDTECVGVAHEDNNAYCRCEACAAISQREGSPSGQWFRFINQVAEGLEKEVPGARLITSAYGWTRTPPKTIRPRHNVTIHFAPIETDYAHPLADASNPENKKVGDDIAVWGKVASKLFVWTYIGNRAHYLGPNPDLDTVVPNIKFFADHNAVGIMEQGTHAGVGTEFVPLRMWVLAKALWNPQADGRKLIDEFLDGYYGPAAPALRKYIDVMHDYGRKHNYHLGRVTRMDAPFFQPAIVAEAEAVMREADKLAAGDATFERRVRHAHMPVWYVLVKRGPLSPTWKATEQRVGKLDFATMARDLNQVAKDYRITAVADPERAEPFFRWLIDYAAILADKGRVLPPELREADLKTIRLIQARQIDSGWLARDGWWLPMPDASDGWVLKVSTTRWLIQHHLSQYDEYQVGKTYRLFVRVKGSEKKGDGVAFKCGVAGQTFEAPASELADGKFHVFEVARFKGEDKKTTVWIATSGDNSMAEVYLDCLWLQQVE